MGKHSGCVIGICNNDMQYPQLHKKQSNVEGNIIMPKWWKDGAVKVTWINDISKGRKQLIQEILHAFISASLRSQLLRPSPVFNKISLSTVR